MSSTRKTALAGGIFYLSTFISSIPAYFLREPLLTTRTTLSAAGADAQVIAGSFPALRLKLRLFFRPNTVVVDVPYHLRRGHAN
jgi:hypothetical protein